MKVKFKYTVKGLCLQADIASAVITSTMICYKYITDNADGEIWTVTHIISKVRKK